MTGLDADQLRLYVIRPALQHIGHWSIAAENLVLGTGLVESRLRFVKQIGTGPALGLWQMEPATERDIWSNYLQYKPDLYSRVQNLMMRSPAGLYDLTGNLFYGAAMCRVHYLRVRESLPDPHDAEGMARYWKQYYNTALGAGTVEKAVPIFRDVCGT